MPLRFVGRNFPLLLFTIVWAVTFLMYFCSPYDFHDIQSNTYILILLSLFSVILGFIVSTLYWRKGEVYIEIPQNILSTIQFNLANIRKLVIGLCIISLVGILIQLKILSDLAGGLWEYFENPISARWLYTQTTDKVVTGWNLLDSFSNYMFDLLFIASIFGGILYAVNSKMRMISLLPVFLGLLVSGITFQRFFFVECFSYWLFSILTISILFERKFQIKMLKSFLRVGTGVSLIFVILSLILISVRVDIKSGRGGDTDIGEFVVKSNYSYIPGNIVALDKFLIENDGTYYWGGSSFRNILKWLARIGLWDEAKVISGKYEFQAIGSRTQMNTYTYIRMIYEDFGIVGAIMLSFVLGYFGNLFFQSLPKYFSLTRLFVVNFFLIFYLMSFYSFAFKDLTLFFYLIAVVALIEYILFRPQQLYEKL